MRMQKISVPVLIAVAFALTSAAQSAQKSIKTDAPDKAHLQKIWEGWSTLNPDNDAQFYALGPHTFFDIAPLKYNSWEEYQNGVRRVIADFKSSKFTVNDDAELHNAGSLVWGTATVKYEMTHNDGKLDTGNMRWTVVFEKQGGKWVIIHEHVSMPIG